MDRTGKGDSFICMYGCNPNRDVDCYWDYELLADLKTAVNRPKVFIFIDHCHSGGFLDELKNVPNVACFTTCSAKGYGYDFSPKQNGAWTYTFLEKGLIEQFGGDAPIDKVFDWASSNYKLITGDKSVNDLPQKINNISNDFRL